MKVKIKIFILLCILIFLPTKNFAIENKILFKIDNEIITTLDILNEAKYLELINQEFKKFDDLKIYEIAKNSLIRERIKKNELKKIYSKIQLEKKFLEKFTINYFKRFNLNTIEEVKKLLKENGLKIADIEKKISIQLMWSELIFKKFSKNIKINKKLIRNEISKKKTQEEFLISEIVFNVKDKDDLNMKINLIKREIMNTNFYRAAIIYSISETSVDGGKIGWIKENSLSVKIKNELKKIKIGEITKPIQIPGGFIILKIEDKKETTLKLDINKEIESVVKRKTNEQLNQFSNIYFNKVKKNVVINEL